MYSASISPFSLQGFMSFYEFFFLIIYTIPFIFITTVDIDGTNVIIFKGFLKYFSGIKILYTALIDKKHPDTDGLVDIMVRQQDAIRVNHIFDRFKLSAVNLADIRTEVEKDKMEEMLQDAKERGVEIKSNEEKIVDDIMSKPIQKEQQEMSNPQVAKTEKNPLSEPLSENKNKSGVASKEQKPSIRETLKEIKKELKEKEVSRDEKQEVKEGKSINTNKDKNTIKPSNKNKKGKER